MKLTKKLTALILMGIVLGISGVFTPAADAVKIHTLLIIDDGAPHNYLQQEAAKKAMTRLLRQIKNELGCVVEISVLNTDNFTPNSGGEDPSILASSANVLKWISELRPDVDDVVWVYYSGNGGMTGDGNLALKLQDERWFHRNRIVDKIDVLRCRLKIFMSDVDSYSGQPVRYGNPSDLSVSVLGHARLPVALRHLFVEHEGFLNLTAATEGEFSLGDTTGGVFTKAFVESVSTGARFR